MKTSYAAGRLTLPIPSITLVPGNIAGNNATYYFWVQARNRVGYNTPSPVLALTIPNNSGIRINSSNFTSLSYEDWRHFIVLVSTTNNYLDARVIYRKECFEADQATSIPATNIDLTNNFILNSSVSITTFPTSNIPEGFRVYRSDLTRVYEYVAVSTRTVDNVDVFSGDTPTSRWVHVITNSLNQVAVTANKELVEVLENEFIVAPLESFLTNPVPIKYYITNDTASPLSVARLFLNETISNASLTPTFYVKIIGYLNAARTVLDTAGITNVGLQQLYEPNSIALSKALPAGSTFVLEIVPTVITSSYILQGSTISLYPLLIPYLVVDQISDWEESVDNLANLKALNTVQYRDGQTRYVKSVNRKYTYASTSALPDNGSTIIAPNGTPTTGRWLAENYVLSPNSVTVDTLSNDVLALLDNSIKTTTVTINAPTTYTFNLDSVLDDYIIVNTPLTDVLNTPTVINCTATLDANETKAVLLEIRQKTSVVQLNNDLTSPGGVPISFSGNNKTDLIAIIINKDISNTIKKRAFLVQKDI